MKTNKVPIGKTIWIGRRKFRPGSELPKGYEIEVPSGSEAERKAAADRIEAEKKAVADKNQQGSKK